MSIAKVNEEQLKAIFSPSTLEKAEGSVGQLYDCIIKQDALSGKIKGNHGVYDISLSNLKGKIVPKCGCDTSKNEPCKHAAALGYTFIYTPWVFKSEEAIDWKKLKSIDDIQIYVAVTPLRFFIEELKKKDIGLSALSDITRVPAQQLSAIVKDSDQGKYHIMTDPLKLACLYLLGL